MADTIFDQGLSLESFSKASDLQKRLLFTILALFVYRIGTYIPLPGLDPVAIAELANRHISSGGILGMFNMFSGGALSRMTVFALNLMPYISSSIIIQLFTMVSPTLEALKKEGETGRKKISQYTKYLTIFIAGFQSYGISIFLMSSQGSPVVIGGIFPVIAVPSLVCGTLFLVWLGEQITSRGVGNGSSLLIFAGIVANMPANIAHIFVLGRAGALSVFSVIIIFSVAIAVIIFVVYMERAQRRVTINYPQRQAMMAQGKSLDGTGGNHLPLKINSAGVIPPIFAYSLLSMPLMLANFIGNTDNELLKSFIEFFSRGGVLFSFVLVLMIVFFSFFYTAIVFNPTETADNLKKAGGFIPGVRPGQATADYLDYILTRLTTVGALYMSFVCILPDVMNAKFGVHFIFGGTGILIIVGVTMDTISQVYTHILSHQYRGVLKKIERGRR
ncbi:MAG: preprotein translocase subunit SecY [Holosporaceae bacterium]|jgi:preprotein translocase subunit SecY|nr:preprotein translocase subunit SecY [Holosporaceae bacterium]